MKRLLLKRKGTHKRPPAWQSGGTRRRKDNAKRVGEKADDDDEYRSASDEDYSDTANERPSEYRKGGYHPVTNGEVYNARYRVVHKLGWGYFSTVWLVWDYDTESFKAMKVQKAASHYRDAAMDEIKLLSDIMHGDPRDCSCCAQMTDSFKHKGPNGIHVCMIFDVLGENILKLIERYEYRGIPLPIVKNIMKQVLQGLAYIHSLNIIHTDLKPENVLFSTPPHKIQRIMKNYQPPPDRSKGVLLVERDPKSLSKSQKKRLKKKIKAAKSSNPPFEEHHEEKNKRSSEPDHLKHEADDLSETDPEWEIERIQKVTLADFGNGCWTHTHFTTEIQTRQYRSPEVILGMHYDCSADLWSAACMCFELITGEFLFDPKQGEDYDRDEDHLALMIETLGPLPFKMTHGNGAFCHKLLNKKGELLHIHELRFWPLEKVLHEKYRFTKKKAREIANFLSPMLKYNIDERYTALEMLQEFENTFFVITESDYPAYCYIQNEFVEEKIDTDVVTDDSVDFEGLAEDLGISLEEIHSFLRGDLMNLPPDVMNVLKTVVAPASFQRTSNEEDEWDGDDELDELVRKQNKRTGKKVSRARSM